MTKKELKKALGMWAEGFASDTCEKLQLELLRRVMQNKKLSDFEKMTLIRQYLKDLVTNDCILDRLPE